MSDEVGRHPIAEPLQLQVPVEPPPRVLLAEQDHQQGGRRTAGRPPAATAVDPSPCDHCQIPPETAASTMKMGMATKIRKAVVTRLRGRSG